MFNLRRFIEAQDPIYDEVCAELRAGHKRTHWMWYVFPQLRGLGLSEMAHYYGIESLDEAKAYLEHPRLGARLVECTELVMAVEGRHIRQIFGTPDDLKFRSSMTLFGQVPGASAVFQQALDKYFAGEPDPATLTLLQSGR
ncbi:MAG: DUF1810 domain-containing protein [Bryobacterales bacterium]|nr:DUF1810 domain-containing protein [Bryobacterales bacterium]